jgi:hypothetical protein
MKMTPKNIETLINSAELLNEDQWELFLEEYGVERIEDLKEHNFTSALNDIRILTEEVYKYEAIAESHSKGD